MKQSLQRQIDNITRQYPEAIIIDEKYTGTTTDRPKFTKLVNKLEAGDTIIFDEVSRMSRNASEGIELYTQLFDEGVNMIFIKEPYLNSDAYRKQLDIQIDKMTANTDSKALNGFFDSLFQALHSLIIGLASEQIENAFKTAEQEVTYLHKRTSEGVQASKNRYYKEEAEGIPHEKNLPGRPTGYKYIHKNKAERMERIKELSKDFNGKNTDKEIIQILGIARNTYYSYKKELLEAR